MDKQKQAELLRVVEDNYEAIAGEFDMTRKNISWPELNGYAEQVRAGETVLDVGCGNGRLLKLFAGKKINYLGTDQSRNLIELAQKNSADFAGESMAEFRVGNILNLEQDVTGRFDWVFSIAVLHHLPGQDLQLQALKNLQAKLKPGGKIVISVWRPWGNKMLMRELWRTIGQKMIGRHPYAWNDVVFNWKNSQSLRYYHLFTKCELKRLCKKAGLEIVELQAEQKNYYLVLK